MPTLSKVPEENKDTWGTILTCFRLEFIVLHCTYHAETATVKVIDDYEGSDLKNTTKVYIASIEDVQEGETPPFLQQILFDVVE